MKLTNITPKRLLCPAGGCPAVYETDRQTYLIIGSKVDPGAALPPGKVGRRGGGNRGAFGPYTGLRGEIEAL